MQPLSLVPLLYFLQDITSNLHIVVSIVIDVPNSCTYLHWPPKFEWYVVKCDSKNGYQKDTCQEDIGLYAQNVITILNSIIIINARFI